MRVALLTMGSRGDVEPFVALGAGLRARGHDVVLATHAEFVGMVEAAGLRFADLGGNPRAALSSPDGQRMLTTRNPLLLPRRIRALVGPALDEAYPGAEAACVGADLIVYATLALMGRTVADRLGVPAVAAHLQPATPTSAMPSTSIPTLRPPPPRLNRATWAIWEALNRRAFQPVLDAQRARLGLARSRQDPPILYGFSPAVVPVPPDWPAVAHVTGYWFRDPDPAWRPPEALAGFLDAGPPPVYLGFGSMPDADPDALVAALVGGARRAGHRIVLHAGWSRLRDVGEDLLVVDDVPHAWLFPRTAAVVHHGGAGTTAAALRAGVPAVVVPLFGDQFFWARRVAELGAGSAPIARERLTADALAAALADTPHRRAAAQEVADRLAAEDGVGAAVDVLEAHSS